jgi:hypothetical protein
MVTGFGSNIMEAASRPVFEPLADLPVEEPFGMGGSASPVAGGRTTPASPSTSSTAASGSPTSSNERMDLEEDLLSHGALIEPVEAEAAERPSSGVPTSAGSAASANMPGLPADSSLIPTLLASAELMDPEVLLGASEPPPPPHRKAGVAVPISGGTAGATSIKQSTMTGPLAAGRAADAYGCRRAEKRCRACRYWRYSAGG